MNVITELQDEDIKGTFYKSELKKINVDRNQTWKIEKILKTRGNGAIINIL